MAVPSAVEYPTLTAWVLAADNVTVKAAAVVPAPSSTVLTGTPPAEEPAGESR